jgi:N-acetylneuraminic acid mutarotase
MQSLLCLLLIVIFTAATYAQAGYGAWRTLAPMPTARQEVSTAVFNGNIYVIAGFDTNGNSTTTVEVYRPESNTWIIAEPIPIANNHNAAAVAGGAMYTFGGVSNLAYRYNPQTGIWAPVAPSHFQHGNTAAVGVINDKIYVAGGTGPGMQQNEFEMFDPPNNHWVILPPMSVPRNHTAGAVINGKFYVVGGRGSADAPTALEVYDPATNAWTILASMPTGRSGIAAAAVNGQLWVFGGELPSLHPEVEVYNPVSNTWRRLANMQTPRHGIWASVIGNKVYLPGGATAQGLGATDVNEVFTVANVAGDFDGDGKTDLSVFRPTGGVWYVNRSTGGFTGSPWGISTDVPVPGDLDGDGVADLAVYRPSDDPAQADFYILNSGSPGFSAYSWGLSTDISVIDDYDGDASDDIAVWRRSNRTWYILRSGTGTVQISMPGIPNNIPVTADFDGDGKGDLTNYIGGEWWIAQSSLNYQVTVVGLTPEAGDQLAPCDYDGDGRDNVAAFRPSNGVWYIVRPGQPTLAYRWGISTDIAVPGDYDADGKCDIAVYRDGTWWISGSTAGVMSAQFGLAGDVPVPNRYLP